VETLRTNTMDVAKQLGLKGFSILQKLPPAKNYADALQSLSFLSVRRKIVCIDDLERKGVHFSMTDVMGLISHLRDQKQCKIVLILNEDALEGDDKSDFERYNEKVIDISLEFAPDATDCVRIAVTGQSQSQDWLRAACVALGISNIRVIKKIERLVLQVAPLLKEFDPKVLHQAVHSLTVLGWSVHSKDAPPIDFLRDRRGQTLFGLGEGEKMTDDEKGWNAQLDEFGGFTVMDEFDLVLLDGIERGFFDEAALAKQARELNKKIKAAEAEGSFDAAWRLYHDSFEDNQAEVVTEIFAAFQRNVQSVTPLNLNGTIKLLKELGHPTEAAAALQYYMEKRNEEPRDFFDLENYPFANEITDPDVRAAFDAKYKSFTDQRAPAEVLVRIAKEKGWSRDDMTLLSRLSVDDFYAMFKAQKGTDLVRTIQASLQFGRIASADIDMKGISAKATEALQRIGKETPINRRRIKKYGVQIVEKPAGST
jgi:hypothetical protein